MIDFNKEVEKNMELAKTLLKDLISFKTVLDKFDENSSSPFGEENRKILNYLLAFAHEDGFDAKNVDNYAGHIEYGPKDAKETLGVLAHLDVVPVNESLWDTPPFTGVEKDGKIFGRGALDDKGPLVASYIALKIIKDMNLDVSKKVRLIVGCDEESGSRCLAHYFSKEEMPSSGFSPDANYPLIYGEKAHSQFDIVGSFKDSVVENFDCGIRYNIVPDKAQMTLNKDLSKEFVEFLNKNNYKGEVNNNIYVAHGKSAHAMSPNLGLNASFILAEFLNEYAPCEFSRFMTKYLTFSPFGKKLGIDVDTKEMGNLTLNVGFIKTEGRDFRIGLDSRIPVDNYKDTIVSKLETAFKDFSSLSLQNYDGQEIHFVNPNGNLVQTLLRVYQEQTGDTISKPMVIGGGTYAKFIDNCVAFGPEFPNKEAIIHAPNEYIEIEDLKKNILIYTNAIYELVK